MPVGRICKVIQEKGYGFVQPFEPGSASIFFHVDSIMDMSELPWDAGLLQDKIVRFNVKNDVKGFSAIDIRPE